MSLRTWSSPDSTARSRVRTDGAAHDIGCDAGTYTEQVTPQLSTSATVDTSSRPRRQFVSSVPFSASTRSLSNGVRCSSDPGREEARRKQRLRRPVRGCGGQGAQGFGARSVPLEQVSACLVNDYPRQLSPYVLEPVGRGATLIHAKVERQQLLHLVNL